jgi:hypothetical protein
VCNVTRPDELEQIEWEIKKDPTYGALLQKLQAEDTFLQRFETWADIVAFMREGTSADPRKDEVLRPILRAHSEDNDPRWRQILTVIFWPGLGSILRQKQDWADDPDDRWQDILCTFLEVLCRIDLEKRPQRLVQKIFNDTVHRLYDEYQRRHRAMGHEIPTDELEIERLLGGAEHPGFEEVDTRDGQEKETAYYRQFLDRGTITAGGFEILVSTRVHGESVADFARRNGLSYQAAKKRRRRAERAIARAADERTPGTGPEEEEGR